MSGDNEPDFPSGLWRGFYNYNAGGVRHRQEMVLRFADGAMTGDGCDGVGPFRIHGSYDPTTRSVTWAKAYVGMHAVHYQGFREGKGIWGTWRIPGDHSGGFMIWPKGIGDQIEEDERIGAEVPAEEAVIPAIADGKEAPNAEDT